MLFARKNHFFEAFFGYDIPNIKHKKNFLIECNIDRYLDAVLSVSKEFCVSKLLWARKMPRAFFSKS